MCSYSTLVWTGMDVLQGHAAEAAPKALAAAKTVRPFALAAAGTVYTGNTAPYPLSLCLMCLAR